MNINLHSFFLFSFNPVHGIAHALFDAVQILLRGGYIFLPQDFLDRHEIGSLVECMGSERVSEHIRCCPFRNACKPYRSAQRALYRLDGFIAI